MKLNEFQMDMQLKLAELVEDVTAKLQEAGVEINYPAIENFCNDNFDLLVGTAKTIEPQILAQNFNEYLHPEEHNHNSLVEKILREGK